MAKIKYQAHVAEAGWLPEVENGELAGTINQHRAMEAFRITGIEIDPGDEIGIASKAHVQDMGWSNSEPIGNDVGSTGLAKHMECTEIGLTGKDKDKYEIWYRLHIADYGFLDWSTDGQPNGSTGGNVQAEAIQIYLAKKSDHFYPRVDSDFEFKDLTPPPPQASPQDQRAQALALAKSYVGYVTGTSKDSVFGRRYDGAYAGDWCCYAVRSICDDCGISFPATGYVPTVEEWAREHGKWTGSVDTNRLQAIIFDFNGNGTGDHIGLVESVSGNTKICLEGNTAGPNGEPIGYWRKSRSSGIRGYVNLT